MDETSVVAAVTPPKQKRKRLNMVLAGSLRSQGWDYDAIAKEIGASSGNSVRVQLNRKGVTKQLAGNKPIPESVTKRVISTETVKIVAEASEMVKEKLGQGLSRAVDVAASQPVTYEELANNGQGHASVLKTLAETYRALHGSAESQVIVFGVGKLREPSIEIEATPQAVVSSPELPEAGQ